MQNMPPHRYSTFWSFL